MTLRPAAVVLALAVAACGKPAPPPAAAAEAKAPAYDLSLDMKELMGHVVDPGAWAFWRASGEIETAKGAESLLPKTEEGWEAASSGAAQVAEAGNLLLIPGRAMDDGDWVRFAHAMTKAGLTARQAAETKDAKAMFTTGAALYQTCVDCHAKYVIGPGVAASPPPVVHLPDLPPDVAAKEAAYAREHGGKS